MESLPPLRATQRRASPEHTVPSEPPGASERNRPEDSQPLLIKSSGTEEVQEKAHGDQQPDQGDATKKCWICFAESTEDTPESSPWRDPCPCALVAHEDCLLDWIADMESPNNTRTQQRGFGPPKIECPQCKKEIALARPRSLVVDAVRKLETAGVRLTTPGAFVVLFGLLYEGSMAWGVHTIHAIFGSQDSARILQPLVVHLSEPGSPLLAGPVHDAGQRLLHQMVGFLANWRLYVGLPLITPTIILSRTTLADSILPVLPVLFFATQSPSRHDTLDFGKWPPSASLAFSVLPHLRSAYNLYYQKVWAEKEKQWLREIQPRARDGENEEAAMADAHAVDEADEGDENVVEVRIDGGLWEGWEDEDLNEEEQQAAAMNGNGPLEPPPILFEAAPAAPEGLDVQADPPPNIADHRALNPPRQRPADDANQNRAAGLGGGARRLSFSATDIAERFLGSLIFPTIAGLSGQLLKLVLPRSWTTVTSVPGAGGSRVAVKGLLQLQWGRSLVGGCLFIVLKDCVTLYVKWKMVQMHRRRRVLDYKGKDKA